MDLDRASDEDAGRGGVMRAIASVVLLVVTFLGPLGCDESNRTEVETQLFWWKIPVLCTPATMLLSGAVIPTPTNICEIKKRYLFPKKNKTDLLQIIGAVILFILFIPLVFRFGAIYENQLVMDLCDDPSLIASLPLDSLPATLHQLQRAQALPEVWDALHLPTARQQSIRLLGQSSDDAENRLMLLASLLDVDYSQTATEVAEGVRLLAVKLSDPEPLRSASTTLVAVKWKKAGNAEPAALVKALEQALAAAGQVAGLPFVIIAVGRHMTSDIKAIIPKRYDALILDDDALGRLLFAFIPLQTFAGMLLTRGHLALSPYSISGEVKEAGMFFGRERLLREIAKTGMPRHMVVGPRRVGKSSLLRQLQQTLAATRPNLEVHYLDLLGMDAPEQMLKKLQRKLPVKDADAVDSIPAILERRFSGPRKPGLLLLDEVDGLIERDAQDGYPIFTALRSLQAEGICSYVLTGYRYLYRNALNQDSPLYNFATMEILGALDENEAFDLATVPMARLGITYASNDIPRRIARRTGGYPSIVQLLCHHILKALKGGTLVIGPEHLDAVEKSSEVRNELFTLFEMNVTGTASKVLVYRLVSEAAFSMKNAHETLQALTALRVPIGIVETLLRDLIISGFLREAKGRYTWTIPIFQDLIAAADTYIVAQLEKELPQHPEAWAVRIGG